MKNRVLYSGWKGALITGVALAELFAVWSNVGCRAYKKFVKPELDKKPAIERTRDSEPVPMPKGIRENPAENYNNYDNQENQTEPEPQPKQQRQEDLERKLKNTETVVVDSGDDGTENYNLNFSDEFYFMLREHEGYRQWVYDDKTGKRLYHGQEAKGNRTIGVGFNLEKENAEQRISKLRVNYEAVLDGRQNLDDAQVNELFYYDVLTAREDARKYLGNKEYDEIDETAKEVLVNMMFNMGYSVMNNDYKKFRQALQNQDYKWAADEMQYQNGRTKNKESLWYEQTGRRAEQLVEIMRRLK